jgi:tetratricopeptide (TPR) repeat protein
VPFEAPSITAMLVAHATQPPPALAEAVPDVHPGLAQLVLELLQKDPSARPRTAQEVEARLNALLPGHSSSMLPMGGATGAAAATPVRAERPSSLRGLLWVMLSSALVGIAAVAFLWSQKQDPSTEPAPPAHAPPVLESPALPENAPAKEWELEMVRVTIAQKLAESELPAPPSECASEHGIAAGALILTARASLVSDAASALKASEQAIQRCASWATAHNVRGNALQSLGKLDEAVAAYREALKFDPNYDAPRFNLGVVQLRSKDPAAIATFSELIAQKPSYPDVYASRAQAYLFAERYREGLDDLEQAVKQDPESGTVWLMLGQLRERLKRPNANDAYCKASELKVESANAHCKR